MTIKTTGSIDNKTTKPIKLKVLRTMQKGEFEKIITEHNKKAKELPPKIVELPKTKNGNVIDNIDKKDITFVVSGGFSHKDFPLSKALSYIRNVFPESKIILSTWDDFDEKTQKKYEGLYDELILSCKSELPFQNISVNFPDIFFKEQSFNHQQLLVSRGVDAVKTKYVVKTRTDLFVQKDTFLQKYIDIVNALPFVDENFRVFKQRVLCDNTYLHNPLTTKLPFFVSDIFLFGLTEDIKKYFNYYVMPTDVATYYRQCDKTTLKLLIDDYFGVQGRYCTEQYLLVNILLNSHIPCHIQYDILDNNPQVKKNSVRFLTNNIIVSAFETMNIVSKFYFENGSQGPNTTMNVLNKFITDIYKISIPERLAYFTQEENYEIHRFFSHHQIMTLYLCLHTY